MTFCVHSNGCFGNFGKKIEKQNSKGNRLVTNVPLHQSTILSFDSEFYLKIAMIKRLIFILLSFV